MNRKTKVIIFSFLFFMFCFVVIRVFFFCPIGLGNETASSVSDSNYLNNPMSKKSIGDAKNTTVIDNVARMRDVNLSTGTFVFTLGYHAINDGGSAYYYIRNKKVEDFDDGGSIIILHNGAVAELINNNSFINVCQYGLTNGKYINDYWKSIVNAFNLSQKPLVFPAGKYYIRRTENQFYGIKTPLLPMKGENAVIFCDNTFDSESDAFYFDETVQQFGNYIKGFTFDSVHQAKVRYYLNFDGTLKTHYKFQIRNNVFLRHASYAVYTDGNTRTGLFNSCEFSDNIVRGLFFKSENLGDSNRFERNTLLGDRTRELCNYVISVKQTNGAACITVANNNCSSGLGRFVKCQCICFENNQIENTSQATLDYLLKIDNCNGAVLTNNTLNAHSLSGLLYITGLNASINGINLKNPGSSAYALESDSKNPIDLKSVNYRDNKQLFNLNYIPQNKLKGVKLQNLE